MGKVYVVMGWYADELENYCEREVKAVFQNEKKAERYCRCHNDCYIEKYDYSDEKMYTSFNRVFILCTIDKQFPNIDIRHCFECLTEEDDDWAKKEWVEFRYMFNDSICFGVNKVLPQKYNEKQVRKEVAKIIQSIKFKIEEKLQPVEAGYEIRKSAENDIKNIITDSLSLKIED